MSAKSDVCDYLSTKICARIEEEKRKVFPDINSIGKFALENAGVSMESVEELIRLETLHRELGTQVHDLLTEINEELKKEDWKSNYGRLSISSWVPATVENLLYNLGNTYMSMPQVAQAYSTPTIGALNEMLKELPFKMAVATGPSQLQEFAQSILKQLETL